MLNDHKLSELERLNLIQMKAKLIEQKAQEQEHLMKVEKKEIKD